jgi:DNA polymerase
MSFESSVDFETRSAADLRKTGAYRYAEDASTDVWCFAFMHPGKAEPLLWTPYPISGIDAAIDNADAFDALADLVADKSVTFRAFNAPFERAIWRNVVARKYGLPDIELERWTCTAAEVRAMNLPGNLDDSARVLGLVDQKDKVGHRLMLQMSKPRAVLDDGQIVWWDDDARKQRLFDYCLQDVRTEAGITASVQRLSEYERQVWLMDQRANDRGIRLDRPLAQAAKSMADGVAKKANQQIEELTDGEVTSVTKLKSLRAWMAAQGREVETLRKADVTKLLDDDTLPANIREALELRAETGKSSVKKIEAMLRAVCHDDMLRGLLLYWGAGTGRWAGRLVQPQNFPARSAHMPEWHDPEDWVDDIMHARVDSVELYAPALEVVALQLRSMLTALPGRTLVAADYSAIEARVIAWLCGEEWRMEVFRTHGKIYEASASQMFKVPFETIKKGEANYSLRQKGKVAELALGFQGGKNALITMGAYDMGLADEELPDIVKLWRAASPSIVMGWKDLETAAKEAVRYKGRVTEALGSRIRFKCSGGFLWLKLPSGRRLAYCQPKLVEKPAPWDADKTVWSLEAWSVNSKTKQWSKRGLYGGLLMENVVQATARDLMADAMLRLEAGGKYLPLLSVHDEVITETTDDVRDACELETIMSLTPDWADGCPVTASGWAGLRYRKD